MLDLSSFAFASSSFPNRKTTIFVKKKTSNVDTLGLDAVELGDFDHSRQPSLLELSELKEFDN